MLLEIFLFVLKTLIAYIYPIWASFLLITSKNNTVIMNSEESSKWLSYWVLVAILHCTLFPILDTIVEFDQDHFQAISLLIKTGLMTYLNFPEINGSLLIYQQFVFSDEQIEAMKFFIRKKLKKFVDIIDLRDLEEESEIS